MPCTRAAPNIWSVLSTIWLSTSSRLSVLVITRSPSSSACSWRMRARRSFALRSRSLTRASRSSCSARSSLRSAEFTRCWAALIQIAITPKLRLPNSKPHG